MKRIIKDINLLQEQGIVPHVWLEQLEYDIRTSIDFVYYFDGFGYYETGDQLRLASPTDVFIRVEDIEQFNIAALYSLREVNEEYYKTYKRSPDLTNVSLLVTEESLTDAYFAYYGSYLKGYTLKGPQNAEVKVEKDSIQLKGKVFSYKEAMPTMYNQIKTLSSKVYHANSRTKEGVYYKADLDFDLYLKEEPNKPFVPTAFKVHPSTFLDESDRVTLIGRGIRTKWLTNKSYGVLVSYAKEIKGVLEILYKCIVRLGKSPLTAVDLPIQCILEYLNPKGSLVLLPVFGASELTFSSTLLHYLRTDYDLETYLEGLDLHKYLKKNQKYKALAIIKGE